MREILFRGKIKDRSNIKRNGKWKYGYISGRCSYEVDGNDNVVSIDTYWMSGEIIDAKTVGEYTGLTDKNGTKIFEGDILQAHLDEVAPEDVTIAEIKWIKGCGWAMKEKGCDADLLDEIDGPIIQKEYEVIGNIHDNPELLEVKKEKLIPGEKE